MTEIDSQGGRELEIELLALDLSSCTRCTGTLANIEEAIEIVRRPLEATGRTISLRKTVVDSEAAAREHRFVSSPTIRVAGRDVVFETKESRCDSCTDLCGCSEGTSCRVWTWQGVEHDEAPVGLIVEALLRELAGSAPTAPSATDYELPENLRRFFAGRAGGADAAEEGCCSPEALADCCAPSEKASCCGPSASS